MGNAEQSDPLSASPSAPQRAQGKKEREREKARLKVQHRSFHATGTKEFSSLVLRKD